MITNSLYNEVLINPIKIKHLNEIYIVSGFVSASFFRRHIEDVLKLNKNIKINLIVGMGFANDQHLALLNLKKNYKTNIDIYYYNKKPLIHSKIYIWTKDRIPILGYSGSSNYSQYGFFEKKQLNQMTADNPNELYKYFYQSLKNSKTIDKFKYKNKSLFKYYSKNIGITPGSIYWDKPNEEVRISFLTKKGDLGLKSGLNWGQRKNREPNQAYLPIRGEATKKDFLPDKGFTFTLITDDGIALDCTVQQDNRKAVSTTYNNSLLGEYIRKRINVPKNSLILTDHLIKYGRTDYMLKKIDDETFLFDMSVDK